MSFIASLTPTLLVRQSEVMIGCFSFTRRVRRVFVPSWVVHLCICVTIQQNIFSDKHWISPSTLPPPPDLVLLLTRAGVGVRLLLHAAGELLLLLLIDTVDSIVHSRHQVTSLTSAQVLQHRVQTPVPLRLSEWWLPHSVAIHGGHDQLSISTQIYQSTEISGHDTFLEVWNNIQRGYCKEKML